jgi:hypothetical protein
VGLLSFAVDGLGKEVGELLFSKKGKIKVL